MKSFSKYYTLQPTDYFRIRAAMEKILIINIAVFCACFLFCFSGLKFLLLRGKKQAFFPLWLSLGIALPLLSVIIPSRADFIGTLSFYETSAVVILSGICFLLVAKLPAALSFLIILICAETGSLFLPAGIFFFSPELPFWADRGLLILSWSLFAFCFQYLRVIDGIFGLQGLTSAIGITLLSFIGAAPVLLGYMGMSLFAVFCAWQPFNAFPAKLHMPRAGSISLGFLLAWLIVKSSAEGAAPCNLCFNMFYFYQIVFGLLKMFSLNRRNRSLAHNTDYYRVFVSGLSQQNICRAVGKMMILLLIFGCFAAYSPKFYALPALSLLTCFWFANRLQNWRENIPTFAEINQDMVNTIKNNVNDIKNGLNRDN